MLLTALALTQDRSRKFQRDASALAAAVAKSGVHSSVAGSLGNFAAADRSQRDVREALMRANAASAEVLEKVLSRASAAEVRLLRHT